MQAKQRPSSGGSGGGGGVRPTGSSGRGQGYNPMNQTAPAGDQSGAPRMFERHVAASKLAAAFRGRLARKEVQQEKRKIDAQRQEQFEAELEANRPKPRQITRPKGKSYIGF